MGLLPGTPVGTSLIDAHAGGLGVMESVPVEPGSTGYFLSTLHYSAPFLTKKIAVFIFKSIDVECAEDDEESICHRMVLVCGTSNCHMVISKTKLFIPGVWGPFWSGMF